MLARSIRLTLAHDILTCAEKRKNEVKLFSA